MPDPGFDADGRNLHRRAMKLPKPLVVLVLLFAFAAPLLAGAGQFVATVSGTRKFQSQNKKAMNVIASAAVSFKTICAAFSVDPKDYVLVFDANVYSLSLIPLHAAAMLPTYEVLTAGNNLNSYNSASPSQFVTCNDLKAGADAAGSQFDGITGLEILTVKEKMGTATGAVGNFTGVAVNANPDYSFFQLKLSAAKPFVQQ